MSDRPGEAFEGHGQIMLAGFGQDHLSQNSVAKL
jgi:hypothetical protein